MKIKNVITYYPCFKRLFDIFLSTVGLFIFSPFFYLIFIFVKIDSAGPIFFKQKRIGQHLKPFELIKFRSMLIDTDDRQREFDPGDTDRVTTVGAFLRDTKLDELPGLFNVLNGDMSIVGPRPEVNTYLPLYKELFQEILEIKPGLSDYASIKYRNEEEILALQDDPEKYYQEVILPDKLRLAKSYKDEIFLRTDLYIIIHTFKSILLNGITGKLR